MGILPSVRLAFNALPESRRRPIACASLALLVAGASGAAIAQPVVQSTAPSASANSYPGAVVQQSPGNDSLNLNAALARLGRNPRDGDALIDAGHAALTIGDVDAAIGFFRRAEQVTPGNVRVKAGLARALVRSGNPFDAIPLFEDAALAGAVDSATALDRGLAYDLVADNVTAQRYYREAMTGGLTDEATRRLAISLAIAGDKRASATVLSPLLLRQDKAAWRARAFSLAIMGQTEEAITVVNGTLPPSLASGIAPYLRYMAKLTPAQQAAAANFGQFPRASEIGRDDPRVALYSANASRRPSLASADAGLIPKGEPLGRNARSRSSDRNQDGNSARNSDRRGDRSRQSPPEVAIAAPPLPPVPARPAAAPVAPAPVAVRQVATPAQAPARPAFATLSAPPSPPPAPAPVRVAVQTTSAPTQPVSTPPAPPKSPLIAAAPPPPPAPPPAPVAAPIAAPLSASGPRPPAGATPSAAPVPPTPRRQSLAEVFSDLGRPTADATPASGAVDIRRIRPTREPAAGADTPATPAPPSHPSRIWVQLATGRDKGALGFDYRRMAREADAVFKARRPFVSSWGQTNRLLTGPFETEAAANAFLAQLRRAKIDGAFVWTSPAGQVVDGLGGR